MPIVLNCTGCGKRFEVNSVLAGKKSRCKQCGHVFRIPEAGGAEPASRSGPEPIGPRDVNAEVVSSAPARSASSWESILADERASAAEGDSSASRNSSRETVKPAAGTIAINCPGCGKRYELSGDLAGKKSRCKKCGEVFTIGGPRTQTRQPTVVERVVERPRPVASSSQQPAELYWEVVLTDDTKPESEKEVAKLPDYDNFDLPAPPRAAAVVRTSKSRDWASNTSLGYTVSGWFSIVLFVLIAGGYGAGALGLLSRSQVSAFIGISLALAMMACSVLIIWGTIWMILIAFRESTRCGLMFIFLPFYAFYYVFTRLAEIKSPASMVAVAHFVILGVKFLGPAVDPNQAAVAISSQNADTALAPPLAQAEPPPAPGPINVVADVAPVPKAMRLPPRTRPGPGPGRGAGPGHLRGTGLAPRRPSGEYAEPRTTPQVPRPVGETARRDRHAIRQQSRQFRLHRHPDEHRFGERGNWPRSAGCDQKADQGTRSRYRGRDVFWRRIPSSPHRGAG